MNTNETPSPPVATPEAAAEADQERIRIRVKVELKDDGYGTGTQMGHYTISPAEAAAQLPNNRPSLEAVYQFLPDDKRRAIGLRNWNSYGRITYAIRGTINAGQLTLEDWKVLIQMACVARIRASKQPVAEGEFDAPFHTGGPALMALGDQLYQLHPIAQVRTSKALAMIRRKALQQAKVTAAGILERAAQEASNKLLMAQRQKDAMDEQLRRMQQEGKQIIPAWTREAGIGVMSTGNTAFPLSLLIRLQHYITHWQWHATRNNVAGTWVWESTPMAENTIPIIDLWLPYDPISGTYDYKHMRCMDYYLPHTYYDGTCLTLEGMPEVITDYRHMEVVIRRLRQAFSVVNLSSLLTSAESWPWFVKAQMPTEVGRMLAGTRRPIRGVADNTTAIFTPDDVEVNQTFTLEGLRRVAEAAPATEAQDTFEVGVDEGEGDEVPLVDEVPQDAELVEDDTPEPDQVFTVEQLGAAVLPTPPPAPVARRRRG